MADERELLDLIGARREGILAGVTRQGYPHLTNIWYVWDPGRRIARVSTTADRVKATIFRRNPPHRPHVTLACSIQSRVWPPAWWGQIRSLPNAPIRP
jgi:hypothetical protein